MKTKDTNAGSKSQSIRRKRARKRRSSDAQKEFGIIWHQSSHPFRLQAGDVIRLQGRLCRVIRVNECSAVIIMNRPERIFKTRFDKPVRFRPPPALFRISPQSEVEVLNRDVLNA